MSAHDELDDIDVDPFAVTYNTRPGGQPTDPPDTQSFWVASDTGTGARSLNWDASSGDWTLVIMNADGSPGIDLDLSAGARLPAVLGISIASLIAAAMFLICGIAIIVVTVATRPTGRRMARTPPTAPNWPTAS